MRLESDNHVLLDGEPAWPVFLGELNAFIEPDRIAAESPAGQHLPLGQEQAAAALLGRLRTREREVLARAAAGQDNRDIAATLTLSMRTVERHLQTIYRKLELGGSAQRTAAAAMMLAADGYASAAS